MNRTLKIFFCTIFLIFLIAQTGYSEVRLPKLVSDGMILQREIPVKIWGWASLGEKVKLSFNNQPFETVNFADGKWLITLPAQKAGGPYTTNYTLKGMVWYQGESNAERAHEYKTVLSTLIGEWRTLWGQGNLPFLFVQLPDFMEPKNEPSEGQWATLRDQQLKALSVPNTAMAVTIGLGEKNDIHPLRKKEVGQRLALAAENIAYGEKKVVASGPFYRSMTVKENKIELNFTNCGSGLTTNDGKALTHFAIAGNDGKFVWAKAEIKGNKVIVWNDSIQDPAVVRYGWADNPAGANLYNNEGLPASPFSTHK